MPFAFLKRLKQFLLADGGSVTAKVFRSGFWVGLSETLSTLLGMARSVVLARLLSPEMFGLMGIAGIAVRMLETFTRPGISQALIARQGPMDEAASTAFTLLTCRGVILALLLALAAPLVAGFYDHAELQPLLQVLAGVFIIGGLSNIGLVNCRKNLDFRPIFWLNQIASIAGTLITVTAAFLLRNVWALVIGQLATAAIGTALSYVLVPGRLRFALDTTIAKDLLSYGKFITGSSIVLFLASELDSAAIGRVLGMEQLGYYAMALTIANLATANISKVASSIMMPAYSKLQSDRVALGEAFIRTISLVLFLVLPAAAGLVLVAEPLVAVVLGDSWLPAVVPLQILACFGLVRALAAFCGYLFEGIGQPKVAFYVGLPRLALIAAAIVPMALAYGLPGAAIAVTAGMTMQWLVSMVWLKKLLGLSYLHILRGVWRPIWSTVAMSAVVIAVMIPGGMSQRMELMVASLAGIAAYAALNGRHLLSLVRNRGR